MFPLPVTLRRNTMAGILVRKRLTSADQTSTMSNMSRKLPRIGDVQIPGSTNRGERILLLLEEGADVHAADKNGVTLLHHAVRFRSPKAVQALIERGANVNLHCRRTGSTPLHRAVTQTGAPGTAGKGAEALEIVRLLLAAGADPRAVNKSGKKPVDYVTDETIKSLLEQQRS